MVANEVVHLFLNWHIQIFARCRPGAAGSLSAMPTMFTSGI